MHSFDYLAISIQIFNRRNYDCQNKWYINMNIYRMFSLWPHLHLYKSEQPDEGMNYNSVGGAVSIPLVTLFMFNRLICWRMWSVLSRGPAEAARLVNCSINLLFSLNRPHTSSYNEWFWLFVQVRDHCFWWLPELTKLTWQLFSCFLYHREVEE